MRVCVSVRVAITLLLVQGSNAADNCVPQVGSGAGAYELICLTNGTVYAAGVTQPGAYSLQEFDAWTPAEPWSKNAAGVRITTFDGSCTYASPGFPAVSYITISSYPSIVYAGMQYMYLANSCPSTHGLGLCFPEACDRTGGIIQPGSLKLYWIAKCMNMVWKQGKKIRTLTDPNGGKYVMHAWDEARGGPTSRQELLPVGWTYQEETLSTDLLLRPASPVSDSAPVSGMGDSMFGLYPCGYLLVQDAEGNGFHMYLDRGYLPESSHKIMNGVCPGKIQGKIQEIAGSSTKHRRFIIGLILFAFCCCCILPGGIAACTSCCCKKRKRGVAQYEQMEEEEEEEEEEEDLE